MKLEEWVDKIIKNVIDEVKDFANIRDGLFDSQLKKLIKENLKAFVEDREVVKLGLVEDGGAIFVYVDEK